MLSRFGVLAEVLTDQKLEFLGEFQALCEQAMIDHRTTSRDHPVADGLAERMVQTIKKGLRKYSLRKGHHGDWDLQLPWIAMGYRFSKQASEILEGMDDPDMWARVCEQRADLYKRVMPMALENVSIAQLRDTLRYATIRGGGYRPQVRRFMPGDYVYLQQIAPTTLDVTAGRIIL